MKVVCPFPTKTVFGENSGNVGLVGNDTYIHFVWQGVRSGCAVDYIVKLKMFI